MTLFSRVEEVFAITGGDTGGENSQLRTPEGDVLSTRIPAMGVIKTATGCLTGIMLPQEISKSEVSRETEIWLSER